MGHYSHESVSHYNKLFQSWLMAFSAATEALDRVTLSPATFLLW